MSKFLSNTLLAEIIPHSLQNDETVKAVLEAIQPSLTSSIANIASLMLYARLFDVEEVSPNASEVLQRIASLGAYQKLEESLLDLLAWQFHVDDYDIAKTYQEKLEMVKASIAIHRKKGTKWAVKRAVEASLQDTELTIKEWFEPNYKESGQGNPYHFKAELMVLGDEVLESHITRVRRVIENTKSLRSHCDGISIVIGSYGEYSYGSVLGLGNIITIEPELVTELDLEHEQNEKAIFQSQNILSILPSEEDELQAKDLVKIIVSYSYGVTKEQ